MAATKITTSSNNKSSKMLLCSTAILAVIANLVLSVDAIRCHQCNSHHEEDCHTLRLSTPHSPPDNQYLQECENSAVAFCRKTTTTVEVTGEIRIVRGCGWVEDETTILNVTCFEADNEGYKQEICTCFEDGCNAAPSRFDRGNQFLLFALTTLFVLLAGSLRRSG